MNKIKNFFSVISYSSKIKISASHAEEETIMGSILGLIGTILFMLFLSLFVG